MDNRRMITGLVDMAALACKAEGMWGVLCRWVPDYANVTTYRHLRSCLASVDFPANRPLPYNGWFLRLIPTDAMAMDFFNQCRGNSDADVDVVLINFRGSVVDESC